jgi:O-antigen ligase
MQRNDNQETRAMPRPVLALLWLTVATSSIVLIEPAPTDLLAVLTVVACIVAGVRIAAALAAPMLLVGAFVLANLLSILCAESDAPDAVGAMTFYAGLTSYLLLSWACFASVVARAPTHMLGVLWSAYLTAATLAALLGLAAYFGVLPHGALFLAEGRLKGTFKDPNVFGPFMIPALLYLLAGDPRGPPLLLRLTLFLPLALALLLGFSRGAWGNFAVALGVYLVLWLYGLRRLSQYFKLAAAGVLIAAAAAAVVGAALTRPQTRAMFHTRAHLLQSYDVGAGGRFSTQHQALAQIQRSPLGIGPNRTEARFGLSPHNLYLKVTAENGWLGGLAITALLGLSLLQGARHALRCGALRPRYLPVYAAVVGMIAESMLIDTLHWRHLYLMLGAMWGAIAAGADALQPGDAPSGR